jgi:hypothetical protein
MLKRVPLIATLGAVLLLTTACGPIAGPTPSPTDTSVPSDSAAPSATPTSAPPSGGSTTPTAGDCTEAEMPDAQPTVYTVYTGDSTNPVTIHYTAFNHDGSLPVETLTTVGPVINIVGYACSDASQGADWVLTATHSVTGSIGCVLDFGGLLVRTDSQGQEDPGANIDCTGNPGK